MEMARTVAVWREKELRFHIVLRAGVGLMALSPEKDLQALAHACIAHEAAHVDHEGHLYRTFPGDLRLYRCGGGSPNISGTFPQRTIYKSGFSGSDCFVCKVMPLRNGAGPCIPNVIRPLRGHIVRT